MMKTNDDPLNDPRFSKLITLLREQEIPVGSADFSDRVQQRIRMLSPRPMLLAFPFLRGVAALVLLVGASVWMFQPVQMARSPSPVEILLAAQRDDGAWAAGAPSVHSRYDTGVTALALIALIRSAPAALNETQDSSIRAGMEHLLRLQRPDGRFDAEETGIGFTQYLAGMALQAASQLPNADPKWRSAASLAASHCPSEIQMAKLNNCLSHPDSFPSRWAEAGGPVAQTAIQLLKP